MDFPYWKIGFDPIEWTHVPNPVKRNIRDYYLMGRDRSKAKEFAFHETDFSMRRMEKKYRLRQRPVLIFHSDDIKFYVPEHAYQ